MVILAYIQTSVVLLRRLSVQIKIEVLRDLLINFSTKTEKKYSEIY